MLEKLSEILKQESTLTINGDIIINTDNTRKKTSTQDLRKTPGANSWKQKVKQRDKVCQCCGETAHLEVHHINPLSLYPSLGTDIQNGITLCQKCHREYHQEWKDSEGPVTLVKFLREHGRFL